MKTKKEIYGDTAPRCKEILDAVHSPNLRAVFDPANFVECGQETYPAAYELLKDDVVYIHIKDALAHGKIVPAGMGNGHVEELLRAILSKRATAAFCQLSRIWASLTALARSSPTPLL